MSTPEVLARVSQLETPAKREATVKLHPALIVQTVLVLDLISDHRVVDCLAEQRLIVTLSIHQILSNIIRSVSQTATGDPTFLSYHD